MPVTKKARVFMSGRSQHVTIPAEFRFKTKEVSIRRDEQTGDLILSQAPEPKAQGSWAEFFASLDEADFPEDFLADRAQGVAEVRGMVIRLYMLDTNIVSFLLALASLDCHSRRVSAFRTFSKRAKADLLTVQRATHLSP